MDDIFSLKLEEQVYKITNLLMKLSCRLPLGIKFVGYIYIYDIYIFMRGMDIKIPKHAATRKLNQSTGY